MPRIKDTTNAQSKFLRAFHHHPAGPPQHEWPHPAVLRRWMRKPGFRRALKSVQDTLRIKADLHLTTTTSLIMHHLQTYLLDHPKGPDCIDTEQTHQAVQSACKLLHLSHTRQRFAPTDPFDNDHTPSRFNRPQPSAPFLLSRAYPTTPATPQSLAVSHSKKP